MNHEKSLQGRTALVTGGARGIGRAICQTLAREGADVVVHSRTAADAERVAANLAQDHGGRHLVATADFLDPAAVVAMFDDLAGADTRPDILVNNTRFETAIADEDMAFADRDAVLQVNLTAPATCCRRAFALMDRGRPGVIVNISSNHDDVARKGLSHYCTAKAGLKMLGRCLVLEWAEHGIRVVTVSPGAIATDMNCKALDAFGRQRFDGWIPAGCVGGHATRHDAG